MDAEALSVWLAIAVYWGALALWPTAVAFWVARRILKDRKEAAERIRNVRDREDEWLSSGRISDLNFKNFNSDIEIRQDRVNRFIIAKLRAAEDNRRKPSALLAILIGVFVPFAIFYLTRWSLGL